MKISKISVTTMVLLTGAFLATSCATDVETEINTDPKGNAISFSPSVGHTSRATEINIKNLGDFAVVARGMHPDGVLYDSYLIGSKSGGAIAQFSSLTDGDTKGVWTLKNSVYWPSAMNRVLFIGYTMLTRSTKDVSESSESGVLSNATFGVSDEDKPYIDFSPLKGDVTKDEGEEGVWADGKKQKDLLVAFKQEERSPQTTVNLNFRHALTQISIQAGQKDKSDSDNRIVKVKGAWIVNAAKNGRLTADITIGADKKASDKTKWELLSETETYGAYYNDIIPLEKNGKDELLRESLMLIPQSLTAWDKDKAKEGAYIMLLCRVELVHKGSTHGPETNITDIAIEGEGEKGKHYHQLFPVNTEKYDGAEYGFVCVPLSTDWGNIEDNAEDCKGAGKHYTYILDICGATTGAGVYPPITQEEEAAKALIGKLIPSGATVSALVLDETTKKYTEQIVNLKVVTKRPNDPNNPKNNKNEGDPVLDEPIKFSVTVDEWERSDVEWKPGTSTTPTDE